MGELKSRSSSEPGIGQPRWHAMLIATAVALLLPAATAATAAAQDEPPKVEAPKSAPPPPPDLPQGLESAPQDGEKKESSPADKQKGAPTAPLDQEKAAPTAPAETQKPAPGAPEDARKKTEPAPPDARNKAVFNAVEALSTRFKFVERYGIEDDPSRPQLLTQYRIGVLETTKHEFERAQGAPDRSQQSRTLIYVERAAKVGKLGEPIDLLRRYDKVVFGGPVQPRPVNPPLLLGLTISYQLRPPLRPLVISLTPDRSLREDEYAMIEQEVSLSSLSAFFPPTGKRVSETWAIPSSAIQSISGRMPDPEGFELTGTLEQVGRSADGSSSIAEIDVAGKFDVEGEPSAFNARIDFVFLPSGVALPPRGAIAGAPKVLVADGSIKRALLSFVRVGTLPEGDGRLKHRYTNELVLERAPMTLMPGERGPAPAPIALPGAPPTPTQANSWVVLDDPEGRFHFWRPQEFRTVPQRVPTRSRFEFLDERPREGNAFLHILMPSKGGNQTSEQRFRDPASLVKTLEADWLKVKADVTRGPMGWLDDAAWKDSKRRVYRIEAALKKRDDTKPVYADYYFVEFNQTQRFVVLAYTERTDHLGVRNQVEEVIRSFQWGPFQKRASAPAAAPAETTTAPAVAAPATREPSTSPAAPPVAPATAPDNTPPR
jgi:hypothetical protein